MSDTRVVRSQLSTVLVTLVSIGIATVLVTIGPPAIDQAAHFHLQSIFNLHGFVLWDNTWYLGRYSFANYSFVFYLFASLLGIKLLAVVSVAVVVLALNGLIDVYFVHDKVLPLRLSLLVVAFMVLNGAWPFMLGSAFLFSSLLMRAKGKKFFFGIFALLAWLSSPLALLALILVTLALEVPLYQIRDYKGVISVAKSAILNWYVIVAVILGVLQLLEMRAFPDHGVYPYWWTDLLAVEVFGIVCFSLIKGNSKIATKLRFLISLYAVMNLVAFFIHSNLGANAARIQDLALPILVGLVIIFEVGSGIIVGVILVLGTLWNFMPISLAVSSGLPRTSNASYWEKLKPYLSRYVAQGSRVELVDTANHQGDYYLPKMGFDIVRGWFRQDDFPQNSILYRSKLSPKAYVAWLQSSGASIVLLPPGPFDFSSINEASLLNSGATGLKLLVKVDGSELFAVPGAPTVVQNQTGRFLPAAIHLSSIEFDAPQPGTYRLSLNYSPYFEVSSGTICRESNGYTRWRLYHRGPSELRFHLSLSKIASVIENPLGNACS